MSPGTWCSWANRVDQFRWLKPLQGMGLSYTPPENRHYNGTSPFWIADTSSTGWGSIVMSVFRGALFRTNYCINMILFTTNDAQFCPQRYINRIFWCEKFLVDIDINLDNETRAGFQTLGRFPLFSWRANGRNCLGVEQKSQIQSLGINRHKLMILMIGVSNHLSSITILSFGEWIPRESQQTDWFIHLGWKKRHRLTSHCTTWLWMIEPGWLHSFRSLQPRSRRDVKLLLAIAAKDVLKHSKCTTFVWFMYRELCQLKHFLYKHLYSL